MKGFQLSGPAKGVNSGSETFRNEPSPRGDSLSSKLLGRLSQEDPKFKTSLGNYMRLSQQQQKIKRGLGV